MSNDEGIAIWRSVSRKGVFEILHALNRSDRLRFHMISKELPSLCVATLTSALSIAQEYGLVKKLCYRISDEGNLVEITDAEEEERKPQATLYELAERGKTVLELEERLERLLGSTKP